MNGSPSEAASLDEAQRMIAMLNDSQVTQQPTAPKTQRFRGRRTFDQDAVLGPSKRDGLRYRIDSYVYDENADVTIATLKPLAAKDFKPLLTPKVENAQEWVRVHNFFSTGS